MTGLDWTRLLKDSTVVDYKKLDRMDWTGLDWTGFDWIGLDWTGLDWIRLDRKELID